MQFAGATRQGCCHLLRDVNPSLACLTAAKVSSSRSVVADANPSKQNSKNKQPMSYAGLRRAALTGQDC
eukprot:1964642-Amphidinium_carterae.1